MKSRSLTILVACITACAFLLACGDAKASSDKNNKEIQHMLDKPQKSSDDTKKESPKKKSESKKKKKKKDKETVKEEKKDDRKEAFQEILYKYKEAQDMKYSMEEVESMGLHTELVQHGWPSGDIAGDVKYLYYDVDSDGNDELIITYYNDIVDIYGYDGENARLAFSTPYRGITEIHPDGMLLLVYSVSVADGTSSWYQYDTALGDYLKVFQCRFGDGNESYYTFCAYNLSDEEHKQVEESYRDIGTYPVWLYEWSDELTEKEYEEITPTTDPIKLPEGELLSDVVLPEDYEYAKLTDNTHGQEPADTVEITADMQKKLNLFLSNFAEQRMSFYDYGEDDMYRIGYFAFRWSYINKHSDVKTENKGNEMYYTVSYDIIKKLAERYFGLNVKKENLTGFESKDQYQGFFENGNYYIPAADGEIFASIAIATSVEDTGNDIYRVEFAVFDMNINAFWDNDEVIPSEFYEYTFKEASASKNLIQMDNGYAIVKKDGDSYKLRYYELYR